jgi:hypothetical protein
MFTPADIRRFLSERVDPGVVTEGQSLLQEGKVKLTKVAGGEVSGIVEGTSVKMVFSSEEVEVNKACSCRTRKCAHIAGLLGGILENEHNRTFSNKAGYWREMVDLLDHELKDAFLLDNVKRNKALAYDLRATYIRQQGIFAPDRAREVMDELKAPIVRSTKTPTSPQVRLLIQVSKSISQSASHLANDGFVYQAMEVLASMIETLHYLYYRLKRNNASVQKQIEILEDQFNLLFPVIRAPESQYTILDRWKSWTSKSYYLPLSTSSIRSLFDQLPSRDLLQDCFSHIEELLVGSEDLAANTWSNIWLKLAVQYDHLSSMIEPHHLDPAMIDRTWSILDKHGINQTLSGFFDKAIRGVPEKHLDKAFRALVQMKEWTMASELLHRHPVISRAELSPDQAFKLFEEMSKNGHDFTPEQWSSVLSQTEDHKRMIAFIGSKKQLRSTIPLLSELDTGDIKALEDEIVEQVVEYLSSHIGHHSQKTIENLLTVLSEKGNKGVLKSVKHVLKDSFGFRKDIHHAAPRV